MNKILSDYFNKQVQKRSWTDISLFGCIGIVINLKKIAIPFNLSLSEG